MNLGFCLNSLELKDERRTGLQLYNVEDPETVAGHSWSTALLTMVYAEEFGVEVEKPLKMAIIHDLAEAETGDFLTRAKEDYLNFDAEKKEEMEKNFWNKYSESLGGLKKHWEEYEERQTEEAVFLKEMDLLDLCFTALNYELEDRYDLQKNSQRPYRHLDEFFESAEKRLKTDKGRELYGKLWKAYQEAREGSLQIQDPRIEFVLRSQNLKDEKRTGWVLRGVQKPETVAAHCWGTALQVLMNTEGPGVEKKLKMAVVHDLPEARTGDLVSKKHSERYSRSNEEKEEAERAAIHKLAPEDRFEEIIGLWEEYQERETRTAKFVKDMDLIDMCIQALKYVEEGRNSPEKEMDEFFDYSRPRLSTETGKKLFEEVEERFENLTHS